MGACKFLQVIGMVMGSSDFSLVNISFIKKLCYWFEFGLFCDSKATFIWIWILFQSCESFQHPFKHWTKKNEITKNDHKWSFPRSMSQSGRSWCPETPEQKSSCFEFRSKNFNLDEIYNLAQDTQFMTEEKDMKVEVLDFDTRSSIKYICTWCIYFISEEK